MNSTRHRSRRLLEYGVSDILDHIAHCVARVCGMLVSSVGLSDRKTKASGQSSDRNGTCWGFLPITTEFDPTLPSSVPGCILALHQ